MSDALIITFNNKFIDIQTYKTNISFVFFIYAYYWEIYGIKLSVKSDKKSTFQNRRYMKY